MGIRVLRGKTKPADPLPDVQPDVQTEAPTDAGLPSAADLDAVAADAEAKAATAVPEVSAAPVASPLSTPPATPQVPEQTSTPGFAPASAAVASFASINPNVDWSDPHADTVKHDSLGNVKTDVGTFGPKGAAPPPDVQTEAQRQKVADDREARMNEHMASTVSVDSTGKPKGHFKVTPQGFDQHGARIPDKVDTSVVIEEHVAHVGPRGVNAPSDTFHGPRPPKK